MNGKHLRTYLAVVDCGSFSKAAGQLYITPQSLMQQINLLEREVGCKLLNRGPGGVVATSAGVHLYYGAQKLLATQESLVLQCRELAGKARRSLRIGRVRGLFPSLTPPILREFQARYPDVSVQFVDSSIGKLIADIRAGKLDLAEYPYYDELAEQGVDCYPLLMKPYVCLLSDSHKLAASPKIDLDRLAGQTLYALVLNNLRDLKKAVAALDPPGSLVEADADLFSVIDLCNRGGIYLVPETIAAKYRPLVAIPLNFEVRSRLCAIYAAADDPVIRSYLEIAREVCNNPEAFETGGGL